MSSCCNLALFLLVGVLALNHLLSEVRSAYLSLFKGPLPDANGTTTNVTESQARDGVEVDGQLAPLLGPQLVAEGRPSGRGSLAEARGVAPEANHSMMANMTISVQHTAMRFSTIGSNLRVGGRLPLGALQLAGHPLDFCVLDGGGMSNVTADGPKQVVLENLPRMKTWATDTDRWEFFDVAHDMPLNKTDLHHSNAIGWTPVDDGRCSEAVVKKTAWLEHRADVERRLRQAFAKKAHSMVDSERRMQQASVDQEAWNTHRAHLEQQLQQASLDKEAGNTHRAYLEQQLQQASVDKKAWNTHRAHLEKQLQQASVDKKAWHTEKAVLEQWLQAKDAAINFSLVLIGFMITVLFKWWQNGGIGQHVAGEQPTGKEGAVAGARWFWYDDDKQKRYSFDPDAVPTLEKAYQKFLINPQASTTTSQCGPFTYHIDFRCMEQRNLQTGKARAIHRDMSLAIPVVELQAKVSAAEAELASAKSISAGLSSEVRCLREEARARALEFQASRKTDALGAKFADESKKLDEALQNNDALKRELSDTSKRLDEAHKEKNDVDESLKQATKKLAEASKNIQGLEGKLKEQVKTLAEAQKQERASNRKLEEARKEKNEVDESLKQATKKLAEASKNIQGLEGKLKEQVKTLAEAQKQERASNRKLEEALKDNKNFDETLKRTTAKLVEAKSEVATLKQQLLEQTANLAQAKSEEAMLKQRMLEMTTCAAQAQSKEAMLQLQLREQSTNVVQVWKVIEHWKTGSIGKLSYQLPADWHTSQVQSILQSSAHEGTFGGIPSKCAGCKALKVTKIVSLHNKGLWKAYERSKQSMREMHREQGIEPGRLDPKFTVLNKLLPEARLDNSLNEVVALHGCSSANVNEIAKHGFDIRRAGTSGGQMYGGGIYFTTEVCKARQYSGGSSAAKSTLLISRVFLGDFTTMAGPVTVQGVDAKLPLLRPGSAERFDSHLVDPAVTQRHGQAQAHVELITFDGGHAYPEYLIEFTTTA